MICVISRALVVCSDTGGVCAIFSVLTEDVKIVFPRHTRGLHVILMMYYVGVRKV